MLLVPGLAITNAIRDTMRTDYVSGVARATEAIICAVAIAIGIVLVLTLYTFFSGSAGFASFTGFLFFAACFSAFAFS